MISDRLLRYDWLKTKIEKINYNKFIPTKFVGGYKSFTGKKYEEDAEYSAITGKMSDLSCFGDKLPCPEIIPKRSNSVKATECEDGEYVESRKKRILRSISLRSLRNKSVKSEVDRSKPVFPEVLKTYEKGMKRDDLV